MRRFLIIEGGSSNNVTQHREGFVKFLRKANVRNPPRIVFAGPRSKAIRSYRDHHSRGDEAKVLVDAEAAVSESTSLEHLVRRGEIAAITKVVEARDRVNGNVEKISKRDAERLLQAALPSGRLSKKASRMGLVAELDPEKVRAGSHEAARFLDSFDRE